MKHIFFITFLTLTAAAFSQVLTEDEFNLMVKSAQEDCVGAHESIVEKTNEAFATSIWGRNVRFNEANIVRFFKYPSGEKVSAGVDITTSTKNNWVYTYDQKAASDLLTNNGVRVTTSYNTLWINANQDLLYAENNKEGNKIILELYCPHQSLLELLRMGRTQSIEFIITGFRGSVTSNSKISGVLTRVNVEKQTISCSNGHEFDKDVGYKFCPTCGEPLK